jgi:hypothetical protein
MRRESLYKIATLMGNSPEICRRHYAALVPNELTGSVESGQPRQFASPVAAMGALASEDARDIVASSGYWRRRCLAGYGSVQMGDEWRWVVFLFYLAIGLAGILMGLGMICLALFGGIPGFVGPTRAVGEAVAMHWKGRLVTLAAGPLVIFASFLVIAEGWGKGEVNQPVGCA